MCHSVSRSSAKPVVGKCHFTNRNWEWQLQTFTFNDKTHTFLIYFSGYILIQASFLFVLEIFYAVCVRSRSGLCRYQPVVLTIWQLARTPDTERSQVKWAQPREEWGATQRDCHQHRELPHCHTVNTDQGESVLHNNQCQLDKSEAKKNGQHLFQCSTVEETQR